MTQTSTSGVVLSALYVFRKEEGQKAKHRFTLVKSTGNYELLAHRATRGRKGSERLDPLSVGQAICFFNPIPPSFNNNVRQSAEMSLTMGKNNVSSVFVPLPQYPIGFGDIVGTNDALLFSFHNAERRGKVFAGGSTVEVYVARGMAGRSRELYEMAINRRLTGDVRTLRGALVTDTYYPG